MVHFERHGMVKEWMRRRVFWTRRRLQIMDLQRGRGDAEDVGWG